jgi:antitoxin (DNA-binding transcriptional repressor) of toxin-antitoxin stability system
MVMKMVNIFEAKAQLSELIEQVASGEQVVICKRNQPVAELRAVAAPRVAARPLGLSEGAVDVPPSFFEQLPDDVLDAFGAPGPPKRSIEGPVAEGGASYSPSRSGRRRKVGGR